ncbi:hypothetical protein KO498_00630 [Lentibacter algarum]|uniref:hypothetical protein n=1 Tax=Lentibacter algarum TaxID=576131 RepID=UPI001C06F2EC|nr:hypothetical protein [Lentibacter algarum]MBU2980304.1 hypothetical protein [Lentibacter algarum]
MANIDRSGPWYDCSIDRIRREFSEHLAASAFPEEFAGINKNCRPPQERSFRIVKDKISVDPKRRDDKRAACNICGPKPKFIHEGLLIVDQLGWLYLIGPVCGEKHYKGSGFRDEKQRYEAEQAEIAGGEYLLDNWCHIRDARKVAEQLSERVPDAKNAFDKLNNSKKAKTHFRRAFNTENGWLLVETKRKALQPSGDYIDEFVSEKCVRLRGRAPTSEQFDLDTKVDEAIRTLSVIGDDEDAVMDLAIELENKNSLSTFHQAVKNALSNLKEVQTDLEEYQQFFSATNFANIEKWSKNSGCQLNLVASTVGNTREIEVKGARKRTVVEVEDLLRPMTRAVLAH